MFYHPEIIVYLWLLPATLMIGIPFVLAVLRECMKTIMTKKMPAEKKEILPLAELAGA